MSSINAQFETMSRSMGLIASEIQLVFELPPMYNIRRLIYQRRDTGQYIAISAEMYSGDNFTWQYITAEQMRIYSKEQIYK